MAGRSAAPAVPVHANAAQQPSQNLRISIPFNDRLTAPFGRRQRSVTENRSGGETRHLARRARRESEPASQSRPLRAILGEIARKVRGGGATATGNARESMTFAHIRRARLRNAFPRAGDATLGGSRAKPIRARPSAAAFGVITGANGFGATAPPPGPARWRSVCRDTFFLNVTSENEAGSRRAGGHPRSRRGTFQRTCPRKSGG